MTRVRQTRPCTFDPCDGTAVGNLLLCHGHYMQQWQGLPLTPLRRQVPAPREGYSWCSTCRVQRPNGDFSFDKGRGKPTRQCKPCRAARARIYNAENREKVRLGVLLGSWGLTEAQYLAMFEAQGHRCAVCGAERREARNLVVDHDHATGVLRGLVCNDCNLGMGQFADNPALLDAAAAYLRSGGPLAGSGLRVPPGGRQERKAAERDARRARTTTT